MTWPAKRKALAFSLILILVSTGLLVTAAATTQRWVEPLRSNRDYAHERSVTKHGVALGVMVGYTDETGGLNRAVGADVSVHRHFACAASRSEMVQSKTTGERGGAVFQLRRGCFHLEVTFRNFTATSRVVPLREDNRVGLVFGSDGSATWGRIPHEEIERRGETYHVGVRVMHNRSGERVPVAGANVSVHRTEGDRTVLVEQATTNGDGVAVFALHTGPYVVGVEWRDQSGRQNIEVNRDVRVLFFFDGNQVHSGRSR